MKKIILFLIPLGFTSCLQTEQIDRLKQQNDSLQVALKVQSDSIKILKDSLEHVIPELEGYRYAPEILLANAQDAYKSRKGEQISQFISQMKKYHPQAKELQQIEALHAKLIKEIKAEKAAEEARRMGAVNKLKKRYDDVSNITWYYNPYFTHYNNSNLTSLYIGKQGYPWLRLKMSYTGEDWIFFKNAYLSYSGNTFEIIFDEYRDKETENSGGYVWEWIDVSVSESLLSFIKRAINDGSPIKMRLSGKYTKTRVLSTKEVNALKDVLLAYDVLSN